MKVFISQPMVGFTPEQIELTYREAVADIKRRVSSGTDLEILSTRKYELPYELRKGRNEQMCYWSHAIQVLSMADVIYLCPGWQNSAGCSVEANVARLCGLPVIGPEGA